ncbi:MAG: hypothetical protein JOZ45_01760, partial [Acidobacteriaceae bacterium]|nr:hypothetical protein [Acidobacteriaceae bacterium]
ANGAKERLEDLELPVPQVDPVALKHAQYEQENYHRPGVMSRSMGLLRGGPDVTHAAHSGQPTMTDPKPTIPVSVPVPAATEALNNTNSGGTGTTDVSVTQVGSNSALDTNPDARRSNGETAQGNNNPTVQQALPTNRDADLKKLREKQAKKQQKLDKKKQKEQEQTQAKGGAQAPAGTATSASVPPSSQP